jgi:uncharacterized protein (TIGR02246 family)
MKEIVQLTEEWIQAYNGGKSEGIGAQYAQDGHLISPWTPFRVEGRKAVAEAFAGGFQAFPKRTLVFRQPAIRVYNETTAVANGYFHATVTNHEGQSSTRSGRFSITYVKLEGKWQVVEYHGSLLPTSP